MKDVTDILDHYRMAARSVWNTAFWPVPELRNWDSDERFDEIQRILFEELVLRQLNRQWPAEDIFRKPIPFLHVVPASPSVPIMIQKPRPDTRNQYWDDPVNRIERGESELHFCEYFDWNRMAYRDLLYYRTAIVAFPTQSHLVGREALLERQYGAVFLADA
jgi:hypothetical protein